MLVRAANEGAQIKEHVQWRAEALSATRSK